MVCSPFEKIIRFPSVDVLGVFHVPGKVFNLDLVFSIFFIPKRKNALDRIPQKYWAANDKEHISRYRPNKMGQ